MMTTRKQTLTLSSCAAMLALASSAGAATIYAPDGGSESPNINLSSRDVNKTYDGSGLNTSAANIEDWYHDQNVAGDGNLYFIGDRNGLSSNAALTITYTFNSAITIDTIHFWTYDRVGDSYGREIKDFDISFSTDGSTFSGTTSLTGWLDRNDARITVDGVGDKIGHQSKSFTEQSGVVAIRLSNIVTHIEGSQYVGFSEVRFSAVPEPGSLALMGLGGLMVASRRRRG